MFWINVMSLVTLVLMVATVFVLATRWLKQEPTQPCEECGATKVPYTVEDYGDYVLETLAEHTPGKNKLIDILRRCRQGGSGTRKLKPRYCRGGGLLEPGLFDPDPPYLADYHDASRCIGGEWAYEPCDGAGKPTSLESPWRWRKAVA